MFLDCNARPEINYLCWFLLYPSFTSNGWRGTFQGSIHTLGDCRWAWPFLTGPKALGPNYIRQPTLLFTTYVWKLQMCLVMSCACFGPRHSTFSYSFCRASDIVAKDKTRFGPRIEPITSPPSSGTTCWGSVTGIRHCTLFILIYLEIIINKITP